MWDPRGDQRPGQRSEHPGGGSATHFRAILARKGVRASGAGLGLAIVMEIAKAHGATITVSNCLPRGARFDLGFQIA
jgi:signal transduction histidine kinase